MLWNELEVDDEESKENEMVEEAKAAEEELQGPAVAVEGEEEDMQIEEQKNDGVAEYEEWMDEPIPDDSDCVGPCSHAIT